jgi:hypothetical protein
VSQPIRNGAESLLRCDATAICILPHLGTLGDAILRVFHGLPRDLFRSFELRNFLNLFGMQRLERRVAKAGDGFVRQAAQECRGTQDRLNCPCIRPCSTAPMVSTGGASREHLVSIPVYASTKLRS